MEAFWSVMAIIGVFGVIGLMTYGIIGAWMDAVFDPRHGIHQRTAEQWRDVKPTLAARRSLMRLQHRTGIHIQYPARTTPRTTLFSH